MKKIILSLILLLSISLAFSSSLYVTTSGGSYATEKWVDITTGDNGTGTVIWAQGNGTYGDGAGYLTDQAFTVTDGVTYYINCYDKYDDGWDNTTYVIKDGAGTEICNNGGVTPSDGNDEDSDSTWEDRDIERESSESFSYTPPAGPEAPATFAAVATSDTQIDLEWTQNGDGDDVLVAWSSDGIFGTPIDGTTYSAGNSIVDGGTVLYYGSDLDYDHTSLTAETQYYYKAWSDDGSEYSSFGLTDDATTQYTPYTTPFSQGFDGTYVPDDWYEAYGAAPNPAVQSSAWNKSTNFANTSPNTPGVKMNVYSTDEDWLVSPLIDLGTGNKRVTFKVAATSYNGTNAVTMPAEDSVFVLVTSDENWDLADAITVYTDTNQPSNTGDEEAFTLTGLTGVVRFAFYANGTGTSPDYDFHFDDFVVEEVPAVPLIAVNPSLKNFGDLFIGNSANAQTFTISNTGGGTLTIATGAITLAGTDAAQFTLGTVSYPINLTNGQSTTVDVEFTPTTAGSKTANLQIVDNRASTNVPLTGMAYPSTYVFEGFETSVPPAGWDVINTVNNDWSRITYGQYDGSGGARLAYYYSSGYTASISTLVTPLLVLDGTDNLYFYAKQYDADNQTLKIQSSSNGINFTDLETITLTDEYQQFTVDLSSLTGDYYLGFYGATTASSDYIYLDNVIHPEAKILPPSLATNPTPAHEADDVTLTSDLFWTNGFGAETIDVYFGTASTPVTKVLDDVTPVETYDVTLAYSTTYYWRVDSRNSGSARYVTTGDVWEFTTMDDPTLTAPILEDFSGGYPATNWIEAQAKPPTGTTSAWVEDGFVNVGTTGSARLNIYGTTMDEWMITPPIDLGTTTDFVLSFDLALTDYGNQDPPEGIGDDDKFEVWISTDLTNWSAADSLQIWDNTTTPSYGAISTTGEQVIIDLAAYSGVVWIGFYGESTVSNEDNDLHVDNVAVREIQSGTDITAFNFPVQTGPAVINDVAHTVAIEVAYGTPVTALIAGFDLSSHATAYIEDGLRTEIEQVSGTTANDFTSPVTYIVEAEDATRQEWVVTVTVAVGQSDAKDILTYSFAEQTGAATINAVAHTVGIEVAYNADVTDLVATFTLSPLATAYIDDGLGRRAEILQVSGTTTNDFTTPVTYITEAEDASRQNWVVTVTVGTAPIGNICSNPIPLTLPAVAIVDTTGKYGDDYENADISISTLYLSGDDVVYQFTVTEASTISGTITSPTGSYIGAFILADCPNPTTPPTPEVSQTSSGSSLNINGVLDVGTYFLIISSWTAPQSIDYQIDLALATLAAPNAAKDPVPTDLAEGISVLPTLSWTNDGIVDSTVVWLGDTASRTFAPVDTLYSGTSYSPDQLAFGNTYFWKIVSYNLAGDAESVQWSFKTGNATPVNPSPADTETICFEYIQFGWDDIDGVDSYNVYIGTTVHGSDIVNGENVTTNSYENTVALPLGDTYYWYVESDIAAVRAVVGTSANFSFDTAPADYYTEGFEDAFPPDGWVNDSWSSTTTHHTQTKSAYRYGYSAQSDTLTSARLDLSGGTGTEEMSFYWKSASSYDTDSLVVVFNNGTTLETLGILKGADADWHKATYTLTSMSDDCYVEFRFFAPVSSGDSYYIDDVVLPPRWFPAISFLLTPSTQSKAGVPDTSITYDYSIENTGSTTDIYDITFSAYENWITGASPNPITVASGATETVQITVAIPALASVDVAHADTLIVTSQALGTVTSSATAITTPHVFDNQEPNDSFANATQVVQVRETVWTSDATSEIYPEDDLDFYQFTATAGNVVTLTQVCDGLSELDGEIALYNYASPDSLIINIDSGVSGDDEEIVYTIPVTGTYYVVHAYYNDLPLPTARDRGIERSEKGKPAFDSRAVSGKYSFTYLEQSPAVISVTPTTISETVEFSQTGTELLNVENTGDADLNYSASTSGSVPYNLNEGFEGGIPVDWTVYNEDGDTKQFTAGSSTYSAHTGSGYVSVGYNGSGNNDWLVTPQITVGAGESFSFWAKSGGTTYLEDFEVWISTAGNAVADFTTMLGYEDQIPGVYTEYSYDLSTTYNGDDVYLAIRCVSVDQLTFYVDDVTVGSAASVSPAWLSLTDETGTVGGGLDADITLNFDAAGLAAGTYNANVIVASNGGANVTVPVSFTVNAFTATAPTVTILEAGGNVTISWDNVNAGYYFIYTCDTADGVFTFLEEVDGSTLSKTYYSVADDILFYQVTSSDAAYVAPVRDANSRTRK